MKEAVDWLSYTYLFVRILKNPTAYGVSPEQIQMDPALHRHRRKLIEDACTTLDKAQMLRYSKQADILSSTKLGRVASHYYIEHETIETFNECMKKKYCSSPLLHCNGAAMLTWLPVRTWSNDTSLPWCARRTSSRTS